MEFLQCFTEHGYFSAKLYHLLARKRIMPVDTLIVPSEYIKDMMMPTEERLQQLAGIEIPNIISPEPDKLKKNKLEFSPRIIVFQNYQPNQKYSAKFSVKNIHHAPVFINMNFNPSPYFTIKPMGAEVISRLRLAPGMSVTFLVTFLPATLEDRACHVDFNTDVDQYVLAIIAMAPRFFVDFPDEVIIPPTPLKVENYIMVFVHNRSPKPGSFTLDSKCPFSVYPKSAYLQPGDQLELKVSLKTMHKGDVEGMLIAKFETEETFKIKVKGTVHVVLIELEKHVVRFPDTYNTLFRQQSVTVNNKSNDVISYMCMKNSNLYDDFDEKTKLAKLFYEVKEDGSSKCRNLVHYEVLSSSEENERVYARVFNDEIQSFVADESLQFHHTHFSILPIKGNLWPNTKAEIIINFEPKEIGDWQAVAYLDIDGIPDRVPLKMQGMSLPPNIHLSLETLDMGNAYVNKTYTYEIIATNRGQINGIIQYRPTESLFGSIITCIPDVHCLRAGDKETFIVSFLNSNQGPYFEELEFFIRGTDVVRKLYIKGTMVYPTLIFATTCLDFGEVSVGVPKTREVEVINDSEVKVAAMVKISGDGPEVSAITLQDCQAAAEDQVMTSGKWPELQVTNWPREFSMEPSVIELPPVTKTLLRVTLTANLVRTHHTFLEIELENSDSPPVTLPISFDAKVAEITPAKDINLRACFVEYNYKYDIVVVCKKYWGFFTFVPPNEEITLEVNIDKTHGIIEPNTTLQFQCNFRTHVVGHQEYVIRMSLFGLQQPIEICRISTMGIRPIVTCIPMILSFGQVKLLKRTSKTLTLCNDSPLPVFFKSDMLNKDDRWDVEPAEGCIEPEEQFDFTVSVYLCDADVCTNKVYIRLEKVKDLYVPVTANGIGTSITVGDEPEHIDVGRHFCKLPFTMYVPIKNCGTKLHLVDWYGVKPKQLTGGDKITAAPTTSFFNIEPRSLRLAGGQKKELKITAAAQKPIKAKETWYLVGNVEGATKKELLMECELVGEFVDPKLIISPSLIDLRHDLGPYSQHIKLTEMLSIKNVSQLPLDIDIIVKPPFAIINNSEMYKIGLLDEDKCCCAGYRDSELKIQIINEIAGQPKKKIFTDCLTDQHVPSADSLQFFQDIHKIKMAFELTSTIETTLQDEETLKLQILFDTTKHTNLKSKVYSDIMRIRCKGLKNKDSVQIIGSINYPNVTVLTPKIDFKGVLNGSCQSRVIKLYNPTNLLVCYNFQWQKCTAERIKMPALQSLHYEVPQPSSAKSTNTEPESALEKSEAVQSSKVENKLLEAGDAFRDIDDIILDRQSSFAISTDTVDNLNLMKTRMLKLMMPMIHLEEDPPLVNWAHMLPRRDSPENTFNINDIFMLVPYKGKIKPYETHNVHILFKPYRDFSVRALLKVNVLGGPAEYITVSGESSDMLFKLNTQTLNFKIRSFHESAVESLIVSNLSVFPLEITTYLNEPVLKNELTATIQELDPSERLINPQAEGDVKVVMRVGVLGFFSRKFMLEIGNLPLIPIEVFGWGVIPQVYLASPRPGMLKLNTSLGYSAIATLTLDYLDAVKEIFNKCQSEHFNSPLIEKCFEDPFLEEEWHICSISDGYPSNMDIDLAIERLLVVKHMTSNPEYLRMIAGKANVIPEFSTTPYIVDFGVVITDTSVTCVLEVVNYGPISVRLRLRKGSSMFRKGLAVKLCSKLEPGETGKMEISFNPTSVEFCDVEQSLDYPIHFEVPYGATIPVHVKALTAVPFLKCNVDKIDFGAVRCGEKVIMYIPVENTGKPTCIWFVNLKMKSPGPPTMSVMDVSGKYEPGKGGWLRVTFRPTMEEFTAAADRDLRVAGYWNVQCEFEFVLKPWPDESTHEYEELFVWDQLSYSKTKSAVSYISVGQMTYHGVLIFRFHMNPTKLVIPVVGEGLFPRVHVIGHNMSFPPTLPWADTTELHFGITNPCPFPVELIFAHLDRKWLIEESLLHLLYRYYDKPEELLLPAMYPGDEFPAPIREFYNVFHKNVYKEKEAEFLSAKGKSQQKKQKDKSPKNKPDSRENSPKKKRTDAEIITDVLKTMKEKGVDPLQECVDELREEEPADNTLKGLLIFLHGSPVEEKLALELAYALGIRLRLPTVNFDGCIIQALCDSNCVAKTSIMNTLDEYYQALIKPYTDREEEIPPEFVFNEFQESFEVVENKINLYVNRVGGPQQKATATKKKGGRQTPSSQSASAGNSYPFELELIQELLTDYFSQEKFARGFIMDSLTSWILKSPVTVLTIAMKAKYTIWNLHLILCLGTFNQWAQNFEETTAREDEAEGAGAKVVVYTPTSIDNIIEEFQEMDADEYENADPALKNIFVLHGLEQRRNRFLSHRGTRSPRLNGPKPMKDASTSALGSGDRTKRSDEKGQRKKSTTSFKGTKSNKTEHKAEFYVMQQRYNDYYKNIHDSLLQVACNWIPELGQIGANPLLALNGQPITVQKKKEGKKQSGKSDITLVSASEKRGKEEKGFPLSIILGPCLKYKQALAKIFTEVEYYKKKLAEDVVRSVLDNPIKIEEYTVLLQKNMPQVKADPCLQWLFLQETPIPKCECNQITDLNLLDDTTQDNIIHILSQWHCVCGKKKTSSPSSITDFMSASSYHRRLLSLTESELDEELIYPPPVRAATTGPEPPGIRVVLQPGELMRCKFTFMPTAEGIYSLKQYVEVTGWPQSRIEINCSGISDIPRLDSRPKKMFDNFIRNSDENQFYKLTFLDDRNVFDFGPIFVGRDRIYVEEYKIALRNASLLECIITVEFAVDNIGIYEIDKNQITLEPGARDTLTLSAAPAFAGDHNNTLLLCIDDNPEIVEINIACKGVLPLVDVLPSSKIIDFGKLLLYRREDDRFIIKNASVLPVKWTVRNPEDFAENFILSKTHGVIPQQENVIIPITYTACNVGVLNELPLFIDIYDELGRGEPMVKHVMYISAECYDVKVECAFENPSEPYLNFGNVKVNSTVYREMYMINRGLYNIYYKLKKVKNFPDPSLLKSMAAQPESGLIPPGLKLTPIEFEATPSNKIDLKNVPAYTCYLLDGSIEQVVVAKFPVCITIASFYNTFTLFPLGELNFHVIAVGTAIVKEVVLNNTSKCPFNYEIVVPEKYIERSPPSPEKEEKQSSAKPGKGLAKGSGLKCGNFVILNDDNLLAPGMSKTISIQFLATAARRFEETIHFIVSDTCPAEADGVPLRLVGTGARPTIDFWNLENTFREHLIVKTMDEYKVQASIPHCIFAENNVMLKFFCVSVKTNYTGYIDLYNNGLVVAKVTCMLHYQPNTTAKVFSLAKDLIHIDPLQHFRLGIIFSPQELTEYRAILEVKLHSNGDKPESFSLCLLGEGVIPRICLMEPPVRQHRLSLLRFPVTCLGSIAKKIVKVANISTVNSTVTLNLLQAPDERPVFWLSADTDSSNAIQNRNEKNQYSKMIITLKPDQVANLHCYFYPVTRGRVSCDINLKVTDNPYEYFTILCEAEAFAEDVILTGLDMLSMAAESEITFSRTASITSEIRKKVKSAGERRRSKEKKPAIRLAPDGTPIIPVILNYVLDFGGCELFQNQKRTVMMVNNSEKVYKFAWEDTDNIVVKPAIGYISPGEEKDLEIMFCATQPVNIYKEPFVCHLSAISNDSLTIGNTWDNRQTKTVFEQADKCLFERMEINVYEGPKKDEVIAFIDLIILYSAVSEFTRFNCDLPERLTILDTFVYRKRNVNFKLSNIGNVPLKCSWIFSIDDEFPARLDKHWSDALVGPPDGVEQSAPSSNASCTKMYPDNEALPLVADQSSKGTLFSATVERYSVDTWFERELPFTIEPALACLQPGKSQTFNITFSPVEAFEYKVRLKSLIDNLDPYEENVLCEIKAKALIPYCHLDIPASDYLQHRRKPGAVPPHTHVLEFRVLGAGCHKKSFNIFNPTQEAFDYDLECILPLPAEMNSENFVLVHCDKLRGYVEGGMSDNVTFTFAPTEPGEYESQWRLHISKNNITIPIFVVGFVLEPEIICEPAILTISHSLVGFTQTSTILLRNNEDEEVGFEYSHHSLMDESGKSPVGVRPKSGILKPHTSTPIIVYYTPVCDGPVSFKIFFRIAHMIKHLTLLVNALSYWIKPEVTYLIHDHLHHLDYERITNIHLEQVASGYERTIPFKVKNNGSFTFHYEWSYVVTPVRKYLEVRVEPRSGYVPPGSEVECILHFHLRSVPVEAYPVTLSIDDGPEYQISLYATIKEPLYHFNCKEFDFGKCIIGAPDPTYQKLLAFTNDDTEPLIVSLDTASTPDMFIDFATETVAPKTRAKIPVYFRPKKTMHYEFKLVFNVSSLCEEIITMRGEGVPLLFDLHQGCQKSFDLGPVKVGHKIVREIEVMNNSKAPFEAEFFFTHFSEPEEESQDLMSEGSSGCLHPTAKQPELQSRIRCVKQFRSEKQRQQISSDREVSLASIKVIPSKCFIRPHRRASLKILFRPTELISSLNIQLHAKILNMIRPLVMLSGSATGMSLCLSQNSLQFGRVIRQGCKVLKVMLMNQGDFGARFWWQPLPSEEFTIHPMQGYVEPHKNVTFDITYRPLKYNPYVKIWANCNVEKYKSLDLALYAACLEFETPDVSNMVLECPVRRSATEMVPFVNPTIEKWMVRSQITGDKDAFRTPKEFEVPPDSAAEIPVTFKATKMGVYTANIYYAPLGESAMSLNITATATQPEPNDTLHFDVEAMQNLVVKLACHHLSNKVEKYQVQSEVVSVQPGNFTGHYDIKQPSFVQCWGQADAFCQWTFVCFEPCVMTLRVMFIETTTEEYQYYDIIVNVTPSQIVDTLKFRCRARESAEQIVTVTNPLSEDAEFFIKCEKLNIEQTMQISKHGEAKLTMIYTPLLVGEFEDYLTIENDLIGTYRTYRVEVTCLPAKEKDMELSTPFGSSIPVKLRVMNNTDCLANFSATCSHPSIQPAKKEYEVQPFQRGKLLVYFEPTQLGQHDIRVSFNCPVAGEFVYNIKGNATEPKPQGPYIVSPSFQGTPITFKNVFADTHTFKFTLDSEQFVLKDEKDNLKQIESKKTITMYVLLSGVVMKDKSPTGCFTIENYDPVEPKVQWTYFLEGKRGK